MEDPDMVGIDHGTIIGALAVLAGSSVGALGPVLSNYVLQRSQTQHDLLNRQITQRETLYSEFIKEASRIYAKSLTTHLGGFEDLVALYALVSRIRLLASEPVLVAAEGLVRRVVLHYGEADLTLEQVRVSALSAETDPLAGFSVACRNELCDILERRSRFTTLANRDT